MIRNKLDEALAVVVGTTTTRDHNLSDLEKLMHSYNIIEKAKDAFLDGEISFEEYICLCEKHEINVDSYMETIEHNLIELKLI